MIDPDKEVIALLDERIWPVLKAAQAQVQKLIEAIREHSKRR